MLTWDDDPATTQAVTWRTSPEASSPAAEIARPTPGPEFRLDAERIKARETHRMETSNGSASVHTAVFTGLKPGTLYVYRVGDADLNLWSEWFQFRSAEREDKPFSFIYFGDAQEDIKSHWSRVARAAFQDLPRPRFILHAGDLVNQRVPDKFFPDYFGPEERTLVNNDSEWGQWFGAPGWINGMIPTLATPGNHEYTPDDKLNPHWRPQFAFPLNGPEGFKELVWYLDIQGMRLISLDTTRIIKKEKDARIQAEWLDEVLRENPQRWTVVAQHHPMFRTWGRRPDQEVNLNKFIRPVYERHGVDLVLQGHTHVYSRGRNLPYGFKRYDKDSRTMYVVSVSGPKLLELTSTWQDVGFTGVQLYQIISIDGDTLKFRAYDPTGKLADAFNLVQGPEGIAELVEVN